jgi:hypothetical protein
MPQATENFLPAHTINQPPPKSINTTTMSVNNKKYHKEKPAFVGTLLEGFPESKAISIWSPTSRLLEAHAKIGQEILHTLRKEITEA